MTLEERIQMSIGGFVFQICDLTAKLEELRTRIEQLEGKPVEPPKANGGLVEPERVSPAKERRSQS